MQFSLFDDTPEVVTDQPSKVLDGGLLAPECMRLTGRHIIEASAGTGKTFNITRIYLRLLLERKLTVQQILVVTFTQAATEELKGRIGRELRAAMQNWDAPQDSFFRHLHQKIPAEQAKARLNDALLHLDEAAVFTIHGFCKRVLSQYNLLAGLPFELNLETDIRKRVLQAAQDVYRQLVEQPEAFELLTASLPSAEDFVSAYASAIYSHLPLSCSDPEQLMQRYLQLKAQCLADLNAGELVLQTHLIASHKEAEKRQLELDELKQFLAESVHIDCPKPAKDFLNGIRYGRKKPDIKAQISQILLPIKDLLTNWVEAWPSLLATCKLAQLNLGLIEQIRQRLLEDKDKAAVLDFNDLIIKLQQALVDTDSAVANELAKQIGLQYPVVLVDEFQDTDPEQYAIFDRINQAADSNAALYMIGDPKQAIYSFRGGDIFTYLAARDSADYHWFMDTNWRSSNAMVTSYNRLFYGKALADVKGSESNSEQHKATTDVFGFDIEYQPVQSAKAETLRLNDDKQGGLVCSVFADNPSYGKENEVDQKFRKVIAAHFADEIYRLLSGATELVDGENKRPVAESDIAILVRDKGEAQDMQQALNQLGLSCVYLSNRDNVYQTLEASQWLRVMQGILQLEDERKLTAALATPLFGLGIEQLAQLKKDESLWETWRNTAIELRTLWLKQGFISMAFVILHQYAQPPAVGRDRGLTNWLQLIELIQNQSQQTPSVQHLLDWYSRQIFDPDFGFESELRLESDENLIRIITQHGSKGLEYPVVFVPFASRAKSAKVSKLTRYYHQQHQRTELFLGQSEQVAEQSLQEQQAEDIRLFYVAITRAVYRCYLGVASFIGAQTSPLGLTVKAQDSQQLLAKLQQLQNELPEAVLLETCSVEQQSEHPNSEPLSANIGDEGAQVAHFSGHIQRDWALHSFSGLTYAAHKTTNAMVSHSILDNKELDELQESAIAASPTGLVNFRFPKGAQPGLALHEVFEHLDFSRPDFTDSWQRISAQIEDVDQYGEKNVNAWLSDILNAELDDSGLSLSQLTDAQTLREVVFYFPLQQVQVNQLMTLLRAHRQAEQTIELPAKQLQGMMNGIIDLVFEWQGKYYVADYKSNHLGNRFERYDRANMQQSMQDSFYDLQYIIYSLALHRYLKNRINNYDPEQHLGGVFYLYLRGMSPKQKGSGIYAQQLTLQELDKLNEIFASE